jgi:NADPH-dependent glutamate synthase beta subunit-like oxidoreductase
MEHATGTMKNAIGIGKTGEFYPNGECGTQNKPACIYAKPFFQLISAWNHKYHFFVLIP